MQDISKMKDIHPGKVCVQLEKLLNYLGTRSRGLESVIRFLSLLLEVAALTRASHENPQRL